MRKSTQVAAASVLVLAGSVYVGLATRRTNKQLYARFPELDHKIVRKAYRNLLNDVVSGQIDVHTYNPACDFDMLLRQEAFELTYAN